MLYKVHKMKGFFSAVVELSANDAIVKTTTNICRVEGNSIKFIPMMVSMAIKPTIDGNNYTAIVLHPPPGPCYPLHSQVSPENKSFFREHSHFSSAPQRHLV